MCDQTQTHTRHRVHVFISSTYTALSSSTQSSHDTRLPVQIPFFCIGIWSYIYSTHEHHQQQINPFHLRCCSYKSVSVWLLSLSHRNQRAPWDAVGSTNNQIWTESANIALTTVRLEEKHKRGKKTSTSAREDIKGAMKETLQRPIQSNSCLYV